MFWFLTNTTVWIMIFHWMKTLFSNPALKSWANRLMLSNTYKRVLHEEVNVCGCGCWTCTESLADIYMWSRGACGAAGGCVLPDLCKGARWSSPPLCHAVGLYLFWFILMPSMQLLPSDHLHALSQRGRNVDFCIFQWNSSDFTLNV